MSSKQRTAKAALPDVNDPKPISPSLEAGDQKMEQIRELMFGGLARDFDRRLKELNERMQFEVDRIAGDFEKRIGALEAKLGPQVERLSTQLRQESAARTSSLEDVDVRFSQALRTHRAELNTTLQSHEDNAVAVEARISEALSQMDVDNKAAQQAIRDALADARAELNTDKLSREDMADLMAEISLRLRSGLDPSLAR